MATSEGRTLTEQEATEIRCQEKSKGGVSYEVILAEPAVAATLPKLQSPPVEKKVSAEEIEEKLKAAEQRRISLEAKKVADWSAKVAKIEEASRKKDELNNEFIEQTKEALEAKMEHSEEKREALLSEIKEKLKIHSQEIEKARHLLERQKSEERSALEEKLRTAASLREENIKKMLDRLKEHNTTKIAEVRVQVDSRENLKTEEQTRIIENKLYLAEQKREKEIQKKLENIRKHERRAEIVRQNKAALANQRDENSVTASVG